MFAKQTNNCVKNYWPLIRGQEIPFFLLQQSCVDFAPLIGVQTLKMVRKQPNYRREMYSASET
jgi:hypothetical protein